MENSRNPVGWFEIYVQDVERAKRFYEQTFQVSLQRLPAPDLEMWAFPFAAESPGCAGAVVKMQGKNSGDGGTIVYFSCQDCAVEAQRAADAGGRVFRPKMSIGEYGFIALVHDTEGNMIGLHSVR